VASCLNSEQSLPDSEVWPDVYNACWKKTDRCSQQATLTTIVVIIMNEKKIKSWKKARQARKIKEKSKNNNEQW